MGPSAHVAGVAFIPGCQGAGKAAVRGSGGPCNRPPVILFCLWQKQVFPQLLGREGLGTGQVLLLQSLKQMLNTHVSWTCSTEGLEPLPGEFQKEGVSAESEWLSLEQRTRETGEAFSRTLHSTQLCGPIWYAFLMHTCTCGHMCRHPRAQQYRHNRMHMFVSGWGLL